MSKKKMTIDKKTKKLLKILEKVHKCEIVIANKRQTIFVRPSQVAIEQIAIHVGHNRTEKTYHPLRRWAKNNFGIEA